MAVLFNGGEIVEGFVDLRPFPWESETSENLFALMLEMAENVIPVDRLSAIVPVPEIIIATDRGSNVARAAHLLRDELRERGFPSERTSCHCHKLNTIMGAFI